MPHTDIGKGRICAAGFDNGIVRILSVTADGLVVLKAFRAHSDAIAGMRYSKDLKMFVTASVTGDVFFFEIDGQNDLQKYNPLCTIQLPNNSGVVDFNWMPDDQSVIFGCMTGYVYEVFRPNPSEIFNGDSYLLENPKIKTWRIKIMEFQM
jgi:WD40 repeat protein